MPAAPTISAVHAGDTALTVVWTDPSAVTGITNYDVRYILTSADETVDANWTLKENVWTDGDRLLYLITGLGNNARYDVQVRVKTDTNGAWSGTTEGEADDADGTTCPAQATIPINVPLGGNLSAFYDRDRHSFQVTAPASFTIGSQGPIDLVGTLYKLDGSTWYQLHRDDDSGPDRNFRIGRSLTAGLHCLRIEGLGGSGDFTFELESRADSTGRSDAHQVALDGNGKGVLDAPDDEDYFQFTLAAETDVLIFADPAEWDMKAELQDSNGTFLATSDDGYVIFRETQFFFRRNLAADTYYVKVEAPGRSSGEYSVHVQTATTPGTGIAGAATVSLSTAGAQYSGRIASATDADYFKIQTSSAANLYVRAVSNTVDIDGAIVNGNDQAVSANVFEQDFTSSGPKGFTISARLDAGTHYVKVTRSSSDSATGGFLLWVVKDDTMDNITRTCSRNTPFSDPFIICQWFLRNSGQFVDSTFGEDIRVQDVWNSGVLGAGVGVAIVDDGFHIGHPDLAANVDATRNHDYVGDGLFYPLGEHGTSVAGIIAARDDSVGMRGVAPRATIFGNNLLRSGDVANEADALTRNAATTGVSNNSWSFRDTPAVDAATAAWELAIETGLEMGYGGKGTVYVWAGGNGGPDDHTNIDGRTNHYGVIAVCATTDQGVQSNYSESGASLWVCGPSSGQDRNSLLSDRPGIYTTRNYGRYGEFTGTSAATPTVAGVVALMRSANSNLTWRDVKLILAATARKNDSSDGSWNTGVGKLGASGNYHFSHRYGFGVVNASAAVTLAQTWTLLPPLIRTTPVTETANLAIPDGIRSGPNRPWGATVTSSLEVGDDVDFIEFVEIVADFDTDEFRDLEVTLTSPSGTVSTISTRTYLLAKFSYDLSIDPDYRFGSAKHLGENPEGAWTLTMRDGWSGDTATLNSWSVRIYGHRARPNSPTGASVVGGQKSLAVSWSEPTVVGASEIISYDLRYIRTDAADKADGHWTVQTGVWSSVGLEYTLMGLLDMTEYDVQLRAVNSRGFGPWSETAVGTTLPNRAPYPVEPNKTLDLRAGSTSEPIRVDGFFEDPDGDVLTYTATSLAPAVVAASMSGAQLTLRALSTGRATVTVSATDIAGSNSPAELNYDIEVGAQLGVTVSDAALTIPEGGSRSYTVVLRAEPSGVVTITPSASSAEVTVDPAALTFTSGDWDAPQRVGVDAEHDTDAVADPSVTISHQVSGGDYGAVSASSVRVTVVEDDTPTLSIESAQGNESGGPLQFEVSLSLVSSQDVTVDYRTSDGSGSGGARAGSDYTAADSTLTFSAGSSAPQTLTVEVLDDSVDEEEEEILRLTLTNPSNAALAGGGQSLQVLGKILDDDDPEVEVSFGSASYRIREGETADILVRLNRDPERDLEIELQETLEGSATEADYSGVPMVVRFGPGVTSQDFQVAVTDDTVVDEGESLKLTFPAPPDRVSGSGETIIEFVDNDVSTPPPPNPGGGGGGGGGSPPSDDEDDDDGGGGVQPPPPPAPSGPPKADFTLTAECAGDLCRARTGLPVTFEDTSTGRVQSRRWDFGDGTGSRNRRVDQVWSSPGFYEVALTVSDGTTESTARQMFLVEAGDPAGTCVSDAETRCLQDSRYAVTVDWQTAAGSGGGSVVHAGTNDSGLFTFFDRNNWEVLIKVLDGCALNGRVWVFGASTTDLGYVIRVTDTATGAVKEYRNEPGMPASAVTDVTAFPQGCEP